MGVGASILAGAAASALFYVFQSYVIVIPSPWDMTLVAVFFVVATGMSIWFTPRGQDTKPKRSSLMSDIESTKGITAKIDGLEAVNPPGRVMSGIKAEGDIDLSIKKTKLG